MTDSATLLQERYGSSAADSLSAVNPTLETLLQHRSVRSFLPDPISADTLNLILAAAQSAPSSSNLQAWSVVAIRDPERKQKAAALSGNQAFIREAPVFLLFCADLDRLTRVSEATGKPAAGLEYTEMFVVATIDAALAAQNALTAAESLGLGGCYIGAARNHPEEMAALVGLPPRAIGLFGMAIGHPDPSLPTAVKPRLSQNEIVHLETWGNNDNQPIADYDTVLAEFNAKEHRPGVPKWTDLASNRVATKESLNGRHALREVLLSRGFGLK